MPSYNLDPTQELAAQQMLDLAHDLERSAAMKTAITNNLNTLTAERAEKMMTLFNATGAWASSGDDRVAWYLANKPRLDAAIQELLDQLPGN